MSNAGAYDEETHAAITQEAWRRSVLNPANPDSVIKALNLDRLRLQDKPFEAYWQVTSRPALGILLPDPAPTAFERCKMQEFLLEKNPTVPIEYQLFSKVVDAGSTSDKDELLPIQNWLDRGAILEDDLGWSGATHLATDPHCQAYSNINLDIIRSLNHFYDPWLDKPLVYPITKKAVDWALGYQDSFANTPTLEVRSGNFSYADATEYYYQALTYQGSTVFTVNNSEEDSQTRFIYWSLTFRALGQVVHLLEDMGQPQHTRNASHSGFNSAQRQAFEAFTNARVLGSNIDANGKNILGDYVIGFFENIPDVFSAPPLGNYPAVSFSTPLRFFTTRGTEQTQLNRAGLADYTNRGFFTGGSLPGNTDDPLPPPLGTVYILSVGPRCEGLSANDDRFAIVTCAHYLHSVPDTVVPNYADTLPQGFVVPPLVSDSIFRRAILLYGPQGEPLSVDDHFLQEENAIGVAELITMANLSIPRAVGYATGMLNFFFRGTLKVEPPDDGVVSALNHGAPHQNVNGRTVTSTNYPDISLPFGFEKVRLKVTNTTKDVQESGVQRPAVFQLTGGDKAKLVAVAHFHRNPCYQPDLSGDIVMSNDGSVVPNGCAVAPFQVLKVRSEYPEIVASAEMPIHDGIVDGKELEFDFSLHPIPINATDLFIQVIYRGNLGDEQDGIAVGSYDVAEPTYSTFVNALRYYEYADNGPNHWKSVENAVPSQNNGIKTVSFCIDKKLVMRFHQDGTPQKPDIGVGLLADQFLRVAMLLDQKPHVRKVVSSYPYLSDYATAPVQPDNPVLAYHAGLLPQVNQASTDDARDVNFGSYSAPLRQQFLGINAGDYPIDYQAGYLTTIQTWLDSYGLPVDAVLHPGNPDVYIYYSTPPFALPDSGKFLPFFSKELTSIFGEDPENYCSIGPPGVP